MKWARWSLLFSFFQKDPGHSGKETTGARGCARNIPNPGNQAARSVFCLPFPAEEAGVQRRQVWSEGSALSKEGGHSLSSRQNGSGLKTLHALSASDLCFWYPKQHFAPQNSFSLSKSIAFANENLCFSVMNFKGLLQFRSFQSLSCVRLFETSWSTARQDSLCLTNSQSLLKLMSIESVMPSNHLKGLLRNPNSPELDWKFSAASLLRRKPTGLSLPSPGRGGDRKRRVTKCLLEKIYTT